MHPFDYEREIQDQSRKMTSRNAVERDVTPLASRLARPENLHNGASHAPREQHALSDAHLEHLVSARSVRQAESGEREVSFTCSTLREAGQFYVVAHCPISIGHFMVGP